MIIMKYDDGKGGQEEVLKGLMEPLLIAILCTLHLKHNVQSDHETAATSFSNPLLQLIKSSARRSRYA